MDDFAGDSTTTGRIAINGVARGVLEGFDQDWFAANLVAGETYLIQTEAAFRNDDTGGLGVNVHTSWARSPYYSLGDDRGDDGLLRTAGAFRPEQSGLYYIEVIGGREIDYTLVLSRPAPFLGTAGNDRVVLDPLRLAYDAGNGDDTLDLSDADVWWQLVTGRERGYNIHLHTGTLAPTDYLDRALSWTLRNFENVIGSSGEDSFIATATTRTLSGGAGNDRFLLLEGAIERIDGGPGSDSVQFGRHATEASLLTGRATSATGTTILQDIEWLRGGSESDLLVGDDGPNLLQGSGGLFYGAATYRGTGSDTLIGNGGDDTLTGSTRGDHETVAVFHHDFAEYTLSRPYAAANILTISHPLEGTDSLDYITTLRFADRDIQTDSFVQTGSPGDDWLLWEQLYLAVDGQDGTDMLSLVLSTRRIQADLEAGAIKTVTGTEFVTSTVLFSALPGIENLTATSRNDTIFGSTRAEWLRGLGGNDSLAGSGGADTLDGGAGRDEVTYIGSDTGVSASLLRGRGWTGDAAGDMLDSIEWLSGSTHDDSLTGSRGDDTLFGGAGDDLLTGNAGDDYLDGHTGSDTGVFSYARSLYDITTTGFRTVVSYTGPGDGDGTDTLDHVEILRFADGDVIL